MFQSTEYHVNGFVLQVSNRGLIVRVHETQQEHHLTNQLIDLPDWVFHSHHAIWLADGRSTMYDRALAGEEIKKKLMAEMPTRIHRNIWS